MFEPQDAPRVFGIPPGVDFPASIAAELIRKFERQPPEALARTLIFVNSARMRRRLSQALAASGPILLPKIALVSDIVPLVPEAEIAAPVPALERHLEMARLIEPLLQSATAPAPMSALYDLADSLISLLDEMQTEGVAPDAVLSLDADGDAQHWQQS